MGSANLGGLGNLGSLGGLLGGPPGGSGGGRNQLLKAVLGLLQGGGPGGGLRGLLAQLDAGGLGEQTKSWVDSGRNQPVSGREITNALGEERLNRLASEVGMTREETAAGIAAALPQVVDAVTPDGEVPPASDLNQALRQFLSETGPAPQAPDSGRGSNPGPNPGLAAEPPERSAGRDGPSGTR